MVVEITSDPNGFESILTAQESTSNENRHEIRPDRPVCMSVFVLMSYVRGEGFGLVCGSDVEYKWRSIYVEVCFD